MNLLDLLQASGGENSVGALASKLGLNETEAKSVVGALSPTLIVSPAIAITEAMEAASPSIWTSTLPEWFFSML